MKTLQFLVFALLAASMVTACAQKKAPNATTPTPAAQVAATPTPAAPVPATPTPAATTPAAQAAATPTLNRPEIHFIELVARFQKENATLPPDKTNIVFVGDSITEGYHLNEYYGDLPVLNRGIGSDTIESHPPGRMLRGVVNRMDNSLYDCHPRAMFLMIGTNNMGQADQPLEDLFASYTRIIDMAKAKFPNLKIALTTLPLAGKAYTWGKSEVFNPRALKFNDMIRAYAKEHSLPVIDLGNLLKDETGVLRADFTADGIHFKKPAYDIWTAEAKKILKEWGEKVDD